MNSPALVIVICLITSIVILLVQNLGTTIQISFLGFSSLPLPLSLGMLFAFLSGGLAAALWNQLALWMTDRIEADADDSKGGTTEDSEDEDFEEEQDYYDDPEDDDIIEIEYIDR